MVGYSGASEKAVTGKPFGGTRAGTSQRVKVQSVYQGSYGHGKAGKVLEFKKYLFLGLEKS